LFSFFHHHQPEMAPQAKGYVGGPNQPAFEKPDLEGKELSSEQKTKELVIACIHLVKCLLI
jgi:hypothetical protein